MATHRKPPFDRLPVEVIGRIIYGVPNPIDVARIAASSRRLRAVCTDMFPRYLSSKSAPECRPQTTAITTDVLGSMAATRQVPLLVWDGDTDYHWGFNPVDLLRIAAATRDWRVVRAHRHGASTTVELLHLVDGDPEGIRAIFMGSDRPERIFRHVTSFIYIPEYVTRPINHLHTDFSRASTFAISGNAHLRRISPMCALSLRAQVAKMSAELDSAINDRVLSPIDLRIGNAVLKLRTARRAYAASRRIDMLRLLCAVAAT